MNHLLDKLILTAGIWRDTQDPIIEQEFSLLFEELKRTTGLDHDAAVELINRHRSGEVAA